MRKPALERRDTRHGEAGFTLLEILVVLAILALLVGLVAPAALRQLGGAKVSVANQAVKRIETVLDLYKLDVGAYPTTEQGLEALFHRPAGVDNWNGPYMRGSDGLHDPWNHDYSYVQPSSRPDHDYDLCSGGPSHVTAQPGTRGAICNP